jgi:hypothetical protein
MAGVAQSEPTLARRSVDHVIDRIMASSDAIVAAHEQCGVPLEDVICAVVRKALAARACDVHQMRFWSQEKESA